MPSVYEKQLNIILTDNTKQNYLLYNNKKLIQYKDMITEKITYYNTPDVIYDHEVDVVKGTSLTGKEVDKNFNTLEGRDIKDVTVSEDGRSIIITRVNGDTVECENLFDEAIQTIDFEYCPEHGRLIVYINNDKEKTITVEGFLTEKQVLELVENKNIFTDSSLEGNGSIAHPLKVSRMKQTGVYRAINGLEMPEDETGLNIGDRYMCNSTMNVNGSLYNYDGVMHIIKYLEYVESPWRVARKADWDDMLDALEPEKQDRNHCSKRTPDWLGEFAGAYLAKDEYGFNVNYCGYGLEEGKDEPHLVGNGSREIWWTASHDNGKSAYVKRVDSVNEGVYQDIIDAEQFYSVRLVRDIDVNDNMAAETIMGEDYQVVAMPSMKYGQRLWINVNFRSELKNISEIVEVTKRRRNKCSGEIIDTVEHEEKIIIDGYDKYNRWTPEEWDDKVVDITYVCEWDGSKWVKSAVNDYDVFFVIDEQKLYYVEGGELKVVQCGRNSDVDALVERVDELEQANVEKDTVIEDLIKRIEKLESYHVYDMVMEIVDKSIAYKYSDRKYVGSFERIGNTVEYTPKTSDYTEMLYDFARFIGAHYWSSNVESVVYNGDVYTWTPELELKGSNYSVDGTLDTTLVKQIKKDFESDTQQTEMKYTVDGVEITIKMKI